MKSRTNSDSSRFWRRWLKHQLNRSPRVEKLEERVVFAAPEYFYPPIGIYTADHSEAIPQDVYIQRSIAQYGMGTIPRALPSGEDNNPLRIIEIENNDSPNRAQLLPLGTVPGKSQAIDLSGTIPVSGTRFDEDYTMFDLRAGDIFSVELTGITTIPWDISLTTSSGETIVGRNSPAAGYGSVDTPLYDGGQASFSYVIPADGRFYMRVSDGSGAYVANLRVYRNTFENETVGTRQIVFVDFDGATLRREIFGAQGTARLSALRTYLDDFGLLATDENALIDSIMATIRENYTGTLPGKANNGYYTTDAVPGHFDIEFRNSRDHADPWGLPNVSRIIIGGSAAEFLIPTRGIAQSVDIGNFDREETAVVLPQAYVDEDAIGIPRVGSRTAIDVLGVAIGNTASHELGHFFGAVHQDNTSPILSLMDSGGLPLDVSRVGVGIDGIFGTADDVDIDFGVDAYAAVEGWFGYEDTAAVMAYGLSTGMRAGLIQGTVFNDRNRNGRQDSGDEGLEGWLVYADLNNNGLLNDAEPRAYTNNTGLYSLRVPDGTHNLRVQERPNWRPTAPANGINSATVQLNQAISGVNFGFNLPVATATGFKWNDLNADGVRDSTEPTLSGVWIYIDLDGDDRLDVGEPAAITGSDGSYSLTPPRSGTYSIRELVDPGFIQTYPISGEHIVNWDGVTPLTGYDFGNRFALDYGDAPAPYPTLASDRGASAGFLQGFSLGNNFDIDTDGQPNATATGDDLAGTPNSSGVITSDEDGITFIQPIVAGSSQNVIGAFLRNTTGQSGYLHAWVDFNQDGDWSDDGEKIIANRLLAIGNNNVEFVAPGNATLGTTFARFRLSQSLDVDSIDRTQSGEVEDYQVVITNTLERAVKDSFSVARNSANNLLNVLANDFKLPNETLQVVSVTGGSAGGSIRVNSAKTGVLYTPRSGFVGVETFKYSMKNAAGVISTADVSVSVTLTFNEPRAVDDSFDVATNTVGFPLNVLANDIEGVAGALQILSVTSPSSGGSVTIGAGNQSLRYTPARNFGGTETFSYTAIDIDGNLTTASVTVHTLPNDRLDDIAGFSFVFLAANGTPLDQPRIQQGDTFQVQIYVDDLRAPEIATIDPGVYAAYLDVLYNASLVSPASRTSSSAAGFAYDVKFNTAIYGNGTSGNNELPGVLNEFGAFSVLSSMSLEDPTLLATVTFTANAPGLVEFVGDPADDSPATDVLMFNTSNSSVPIRQVRYGRATLEIVGNSVEFPTAVDDSFEDAIDADSFENALAVLPNDLPGSTGVIRLSNVTQPNNGSTFVDDMGTSSLTDDVIRYTPNSGFVGMDQFTYTIVDTRGFTSVARVTVQVGDAQSDDELQLRLEVRDKDGNLVSNQSQEGTLNVTPTDNVFYVLGYLKDLRAGASRAGVFAAFQDILYNQNLGTPIAATGNSLGFNIDFFQTNARYNFLNSSFKGQYAQVVSGSISTPNLINEVGSVQISNDPLGNDEYLQFAIAFQANATGRLALINDPADLSPFHDSLFYESTGTSTDRFVVAPEKISYLSTAVNIVMGEGEGFTNGLNAMDVNNDGRVSPIDILVLLNSLNSQGSRPLGGGNGEGEDGPRHYYYDVNADGRLSPHDALLVINFLNGRATGSGEGEGEGEGSSLNDAALVLSQSSIQSPAISQSTVNREVLGQPVYGPMMPSTEPKDEVAGLSLADYLSEKEDAGDQIDAFFDELGSGSLENW